MTGLDHLRVEYSSGAGLGDCAFEVLTDSLGEGLLHNPVLTAHLLGALGPLRDIGQNIVLRTNSLLAQRGAGAGGLHDGDLDDVLAGGAGSLDEGLLDSGDVGGRQAGHLLHSLTGRSGFERARYNIATNARLLEASLARKRLSEREGDCNRSLDDGILLHNWAGAAAFFKTERRSWSRQGIWVVSVSGIDWDTNDGAGQRRRVGTNRSWKGERATSKM